MWSLCLHLRECIICWIDGVLQRGNAVSFLTICDTSCTTVKCNATDHNIPHERERESGKNVQCGNAHNVCNNERGESISGECIHFPFPFPLPPAMHSGISRPREQGAPADILASSSQPLLKGLLSFSFFRTFALDIETKSDRKSWLELLVCPPQYGPFIFQPWLAPPPNPQLLVNIGHSCWKHQHCLANINVEEKIQEWKYMRLYVPQITVDKVKYFRIFHCPQFVFNKVYIVSAVTTPHICHNHHNRWLCKSFESSVKV